MPCWTCRTVKYLLSFSFENSCCRPLNGGWWLGNVLKRQLRGREWRSATAPSSPEAVIENHAATTSYGSLTTGQHTYPLRQWSKLTTFLCEGQASHSDGGGTPSWTCSQSNMVRGLKNICRCPHVAVPFRIPLYILLNAVFPHTTWIHCRGTKLNITEVGICGVIWILTLIVGNFFSKWCQTMSRYIVLALFHVSIQERNLV